MSDFSVCPMCSKPFKAPAGSGGKRGKCSHCGEVFTIPVEAPPLPPPPPMAPPPKTAKPPAPPQTDAEAASPKDSILTLCGAAAFVTWLITMRAPFPSLCRAHYVGLAVWSGLLTWAFARRHVKRAITLAFLVAFTVSIIWWRFDYEIRHWSPDDEEPGQSIYYTDYVYRGSWTPFYRKYLSRAFSLSQTSYYNAEGAMTDTGKLHGPWPWSTSKHGDDVDPEDQYTSGTDFYWYGEKITEGEWHLRADK